MKKALLITTAASAMVALLGFAASSEAQDAQPAAAQGTPPQTTTPAAKAPDATEVVVVGIRKSLRDALQTKRAATGVVEVISSKDIGALPDVSIAETLNTVPGVNTSRDRGNDSQASIGGQGPRLVLGLLNGREMASSEPDRNVRWEIFPSEIVSGVTIYKSSEANLPTGGISGTIDVTTIRPLDYSGPALTVRAGPVLYDGGKAYPGFNGLGDRFSGAYVTKLTPQLGFVIAGTYQDQKNGYEDVQGGGWNTGPGNDPGPLFVPNGPPVATPWGPSYEGKNIDTVRSAVSSTLQWKPSDIFTGRIDALYSSERISEQDNGAWISGWGNWGGADTGDYSNTVVENGALVKADVSAAAGATINPEIAQYHQDMKLFATGANGQWNLGDWQVVGDVSYSQAERYGLWQSVNFDSPIGNSSFDYTGIPQVSVSVNPYQAAQNGTLVAQDGNAAVSHLKDALSTAKFDAIHNLGAGWLTAIKIGVSASHREKDDAGGGATTTGTAQATNSTPSPAPLCATCAVSASYFTPFNYDKLVAPTMLSGNYNQLATLIYGAAGAAEMDPDYKDTPFTSHVYENVVDAYAQGLYDTSLGGKPLNGDFGLHVTHVETSSHAPVAINGGTPTETVEGETYTKVLPSVNAKWEIDDGVYIKSGLAEVLSRPALNDLRADTTYSYTVSNGALQSGASGGGGNPLLKPYNAEQFNLTYENYFHKDGLFSVNAYYKEIHNYIGYNTETIPVPAAAGVPGTLQFTTPLNDPKAGNLEGLEFIFRTPFYFIPHMEKFGIDANTSFVSTNIHESSPAGHPFLMNGVAKTSGNVELYYADGKFETRLGLKFHSPYTQLYGWDASGSGLSAIKSESILDYSALYNINKSVTVRFQAGNLLNTPLRTYDLNNPALTDRNDYYGRRYEVDLTYKY